MAKQVFKTLRGINTVTAPTRLKEGEFQFMQNVRGRPFFNLAKRRGIAPVSSSSNPIYFIGDFEMDEITFPLQWDSQGLTFFASTVSPVLPFAQPDPYPVSDPLDPHGIRLVNFPIEGLMRAINERYARLGNVGVTFPNRKYDASGNSIDEAPALDLLSNYVNGGGPTDLVCMPQNGFYASDIAWYDEKNALPAGTRQAQLVNLIRTGVSNVMANYIKEIEGQASPVLWDAVSLPLPDVATTANYNQIKAQLRVAVTNLTDLVEFGSYHTVIAGITLRSSTKENRNGLAVSSATYDLAVSDAIADWNASHWSINYPFNVGKRGYTGQTGTFQATIVSARGRVWSDLTYLPSGAASLYLKATFDGVTPGNNPPVPADSAFHFYSLATTGADWGSDKFGDSIPSVPALNADVGWKLIGAYVVYRPNFLNP